ncbi:periplasmic ligand-binding sensor domain [Vibrio sp. B1FLJ16]|uniref:diguanylate cyclase n=1 Tax=Vibrio sp. B1FLJ16 TaxID=2751178 RepID=UPI0015F3EB63|nr:diguanylate cyclase [Vibrio sp. B1FLJ16]CAD7817533.1 periplasmic ligand-binding sensor domain [Vibrio sp. B1FLJ16]CAE6931541.1 periplasmic ligand-binding sensor domain [Vibrio sp. B1FLJ16]
MHYFSKKQYYFSLFFLTFFVLCVGIIELTQQSHRELNREQLQIEAKVQLSILRSNLEAELMADIYKASTLGTLVTLLPKSNKKELSIAADRVVNKSKNITAIGVAENDVLNFIFPAKGNEDVLGLDYRTVPEQWVQVQKAREIQEIFIAGPVSLVQGGLGLIVRVPVFRDPPLNSDYWGVISAVIDFDSLLKATGVIDFSQRYPLMIRGYDSEGESGGVFFGTKSTSKPQFAQETVHFPHGSWSLTVFPGGIPEHQLPWYSFHMVRMIGYPALLVLSIALFAIYRLYIIADTRALHDELTQLPNRRYFMKSYKRQFADAKRHNHRDSFALINIDLNRFKYINDTYGHDAGDKVLRATALRIKSSLKSTDMLARVGGDEFLAVVNNPTSEAHLFAVLEKLRQSLSSTPVVYEKESFYVSVSIGYAMFDPTIDSPEQMMKIADQKMYQQKHSSSQNVQKVWG